MIRGRMAAGTQMPPRPYDSPYSFVPSLTEKVSPPAW